MTQTYSDGTISVANGSTSVTGSGTAWAVALITDGVLHAGGATGVIASVNSDTSVTLTRAWAGPTLAGSAYDIVLESAEAARTVVANRQMADIVARLDLGIALKDIGALGPIADRDGYDTAVEGFTFGATDDASGDLVIYVRDDAETSGWSGPFPWRGPAGTGGAQGPKGDTGGAFAYAYDSTTTMDDPGDGYFRLNNATPASATSLALSSALASAVDVSALIAAELGGAEIDGRVIITSGTSRLEFDVIDLAEDTSGDWLELTVANGTIVGSLSNGDPCDLVFTDTKATSARDAAIAAQEAAETAQAAAEAASLIEYAAFWYNQDESAIAEGGWPLTRKATRSLTLANLYAEITHGDVSDTLDIELFVEGVSVYGPETVTYGTPIDLDDLEIAVTAGDKIGVDLKDATGTPHGFWLQISGV
ncbi:MAG: hypothetical protein KDK08_28935 [Rhizobiaceae bacterium]|nr:hypothetical protein [Rhizobiaceae bacterium]